MSNTNASIRALSEHVGVYRSSDRVVRVRGEDARSWLNGQVSNDLRSLEPGVARYALALAVKGRIVSDLWVVEDDPGMALVLPAETSEAALQRFEQHIIMEDVELAPEPELDVLTVQGPRAGELASVVPAGMRRYACPRLSAEGFDCWVARADAARVFEALTQYARELGGAPIDDAGWAAAHVALAVPRHGADFGEHCYPQEAGLAARALSFSKGCYLGQEVVYMLENRGQVARRLVQLEGRGPALAGGTVVADASGARLGEVTSSAIVEDARSLALAFVKRAFAEPGRELWVEGSPWRVTRVVGA